MFEAAASAGLGYEGWRSPAVGRIAAHPAGLNYPEILAMDRTGAKRVTALMARSAANGR